jgi:hypothetical protein
MFFPKKSGDLEKFQVFLLCGWRIFAGTLTYFAIRMAHLTGNPNLFGGARRIRVG